MENIYSVNYRIVHHAPFQLGCSAPESTAFSVGPPAIAIEALSELRDLLSSLQKSSPCDKPRPHRAIAGGEA